MADSKKILIIDDDKKICALLKSRLEKNEKYKIIFSLEGMQGIMLAKKEEPDLIILDLIMEGLDGNEVARMLNEKPETKDIPIIFLSSLITEGDVSTGGEFVSEQYFIPKTSNLDGIISGIEKYIQKYL